MIDAHAHACGELLTPEGILRTLDSNGVDKVVLAPGEHGSTKTYGLPNLARYFPRAAVGNVTNVMTKVVVRLSGSAKQLVADNEFVYGLTRACPGRVLQFYWLLLHKGFDRPIIDGLYRSWRFSGLKVHQCWDRFDVRGPAFADLADYAADIEIPVFIHLDGAAQCRGLAEVAAARPDTVFIVGHLYGLEHFVRFDRPIPNVYFDISCPDLVSDVRLGAALDHFGASRLILGSDSPYGRNNLARGIQRIQALGISKQDKDLILGGNIARLLGVAATGEVLTPDRFPPGDQAAQQADQADSPMRRG
jgi:predicted TIM-barrel fold metal-dependent hydrolase